MVVAVKTKIGLGIYTPREAVQRGTCLVALDATRRFGQPIVEPYGVLAQSLSDSVISEGSIDAAVKAHDVERDAVVAALKYTDDTAGLAAFDVK